jgi:hypothetical protein
MASYDVANLTSARPMALLAPRHRHAFWNPRLLSYMAADDVASKSNTSTTSNISHEEDAGGRGAGGDPRGVAALHAPEAAPNRLPGRRARYRMCEARYREVRGLPGPTLKYASIAGSSSGFTGSKNATACVSLTCFSWSRRAYVTSHPRPRPLPESTRSPSGDADADAARTLPVLDVGVGV